MLEPAGDRGMVAKYSIVSAVYNVAPYLEEFIASVEAQDYPLDRLQVVMVDDGSTDSSSEILAAWQTRRPELVTVVSKDNGGIASARNAGLPHVRGEWVTFPDPDDKFAPDYFTEVDTFLADCPEAEMAATRRTLYFEATGELRPHPLQAHFNGPNRLRNLDENPEHFHEAVNSSFFRTEIVVGEGLRFDERVKPAYEDGQFCFSYLLRLERPLVAFVGSANYTYRKRLDKSSALDNSKANPDNYTAQLEHGYLNVLEQAYARRGYVPHWLQTNLLYQLSWYFQDDANGRHMPHVPGRDIAEEFHVLLAKISKFLDPMVINTFKVRRFDLAWRGVLLHSYDTKPWHSEFTLLSKLDTYHRLVRVSYRYTHTCPHETFFSNGVVVEPHFQKTWSIVQFDRTVMFERVVWLPVGDIRVKLDDVDVEVRLSGPERPRHSLPASMIRAKLLPQQAATRAEQARAAARRHPLTLSDRLLVRFAGSKLVQRYFGDAWVLMDRIENADDSGEILFRYLREHRPKINAWFVIRKGTPDHRRLRKDGYKRIIPYGSLRWKLLLLNCRHLVSSHADAPITHPRAITSLRAPRWRFSFLQHGVIKSDLSRWLNPKDLDLFFTSTRAEHESIVADGSVYRYGERETHLTGLPRFDVLRAAGERVKPQDRDLILLAPTWRRWLTVLGPGKRKSTISPAEFLATDFGINWLGLIRSEQLKALAERQGARVGLLLHPDLQALSDHLDLPDHVVVLKYADIDVRATFARARVLVTDYSSVAFNAAYIDRPVVYFQFDRERAWNGEHNDRQGYFDYERDGYGPVALTLDEAITAVVDTVEFGPSPRPEYLARIAEAFPVRDGRCTERVFEVIRESTRRRPRSVITPPAAGASSKPADVLPPRGSRLSIVRAEESRAGTTRGQNRQQSTRWPAPPVPHAAEDDPTPGNETSFVRRLGPSSEERPASGK